MNDLAKHIITRPIIKAHVGPFNTLYIQDSIFEEKADEEDTSDVIGFCPSIHEAVQPEPQRQPYTLDDAIIFLASAGLERAYLNDLKKIAARYEMLTKVVGNIYLENGYVTAKLGKIWIDGVCDVTEKESDIFDEFIDEVEKEYAKNNK